MTVVGSVNLDLVARCERLPRAGETVTDATFERVPGGKGANQAVACARLGARVRSSEPSGATRSPRRRSRAARREVELDLREVDEPTGVALILVDAAGENQIVVAPGANATPRLRSSSRRATPCSTQLEIPDEAVVSAWEGATGLFALNAAPARPVRVDPDLTIVNRYELEALTRRDGLVAVTLGAEGALLLEDGRRSRVRAPPPVTAVDGTAAGDAFTAALLVSLLEGLDREDALRRACAAGALAASRFGAQPSLPTAAEVDAASAR